jgi:hypothetical protein
MSCTIRAPRRRRLVLIFSQSGNRDLALLFCLDLDQRQTTVSLIAGVFFVDGSATTAAATTI